MSDYGDYDAGDYDAGDYDQNDYGDGDYSNNQMEVQDEDPQTTAMMGVIEAEQLLKKNQTAEYFEQLDKWYTYSEEKNLKEYKIKILYMYLEIHCKNRSAQKIQQILERISNLNKQQKYPDASIKSVILVLKSLPKDLFNKNKKFLYEFINELNSTGKIDSYLLLLEKAIEQKQTQEAEILFDKINQLFQDERQVKIQSLIKFYSFQIKDAKNFQKDISRDIRKMQMKLSGFEGLNSTGQGRHLSVIKEAIAEILFLDDNLQDCAVYLCEAFQENVKYGNDQVLKKRLLKANLFICLLTNKSSVFGDNKFCALNTQDASSLKGENDIQCLYGLVEAFKDKNLVQFTTQLKLSEFSLVQPYANLESQVVCLLKCNKLLEIIKPYNKIKLGYLSKRLNTNDQQIERMIYNLITANKINGRMRRKEKGEILLDIYEPKDEFLAVQLENIQKIKKKYL